jgi:hypothetical protein
MLYNVKGGNKMVICIIERKEDTPLLLVVKWEKYKEIKNTYKNSRWVKRISHERIIGHYKGG